MLIGKNVHITLWQRTGKGKQPFFFHMRDDQVFGFAGLVRREVA